MEFSLKNPFVKFIVIGLGVYLAWYVLYEFYLRPQQWLDLFVVNSTISISDFITKLLGFATFKGEDRLWGIDGTPGLWVGDKCNGVELFALFSVFVVAYPGGWQKKNMVHTSRCFIYTNFKYYTSCWPGNNPILLY